MLYLVKMLQTIYRTKTDHSGWAPARADTSFSSVKDSWKSTCRTLSLLNTIPTRKHGGAASSWGAVFSSWNQESRQDGGEIWAVELNKNLIQSAEDPRLDQRPCPDNLDVKVFFYWWPQMAVSWRKLEDPRVSHSFISEWQRFLSITS